MTALRRRESVRDRAGHGEKSPVPWIAAKGTSGQNFPGGSRRREAGRCTERSDAARGCTSVSDNGAACWGPTRARVELGRSRLGCRRRGRPQPGDNVPPGEAVRRGAGLYRCLRLRCGVVVSTRAGAGMAYGPPRRGRRKERRQSDMCSQKGRRPGAGWRVVVQVCLGRQSRRLRGRRRRVQSGGNVASRKRRRRGAARRGAERS